MKTQPPLHGALRAPLFMLFMAACGAEDTSADADSPLSKSRPKETIALNSFTLTDSCAKSRKSVCDECKGKQRQRGSECWSTCTSASFSFVGNVPDCASVCRGYSDVSYCDLSCAGAETDCAERTYAFQVNEEPDPSIQTACALAVENTKTCTGQIVPDHCGLYARVERPEVVAAYECLAAAKCTANTDCLGSLTPVNIATALIKACPAEYIETKLVDRLNEEARWLRSEALEDAQICKRACGSGDYVKCLQAWLQANTGEPL